MTMTVLELQNITKRFGALTANDDISLKLERGEILAFWVRMVLARRH